MKNKFLACIILFATAFIFYGNSISNKFVLDDLIVITGNNFTQKGFGGLKDIFMHDAFVGAYGQALNLSGGRYRPLSIASFAIEKEIFGYKPEVFHFFNVLFFAFTVVMMFLFLSRLISSIKIAGNQFNYVLPFISALLFAILPIHSEVVANIKSCDEIFALLFSIITFFLLLSQPEKKVAFKVKPKTNKINQPLPKATTQNINLVASAIIFFLALLSKENAITFLVLIPFGLRMFTNDSVKNIIIKTIPLAIVAGIYIIMRANLAGIIGDRVTTDIMDDPYLHATLIQKLATISQVQLRYLVLLIFPYRLSYDYSYNQIPLVNWSNLIALVSIVLHIAALVYALKNIRRNKIVSYFIFFYFITFSIFTNLVFNIGTSMAERFAYMPSFGLCVLLAYSLIKILQVNLIGSPVLKPATVIVVLFLVFAAAIKTIARNKDWSDNYTLYKADFNKVPNSSRARLYYGIECLRQYQKTNDPAFMDEAISQIRKSAEINPKFHFAWLNLGVAYDRSNKWPESIDCYEHVLKLQPGNEQALNGLGYAYGKGLNQPDKAIPYFEKLLFEKKSTKPENYEGLGLCYAVKGNFTEAINYFKQGIAINPASARLYYNAAITYSSMGKKDSSNIYFNQAFDLDPSLKK